MLAVCPAPETLLTVKEFLHEIGLGDIPIPVSISSYVFAEPDGVEPELNNQA